MYAGAIGYNNNHPIVLQQNFADPLYYDNSDGKESLALELSPSLYERPSAYFACSASVVVYEKSSPTPNPARAPAALRTMYLKMGGSYDSVDNMSSGYVSLPAGQYLLKNIFCRGSVTKYSGWNVVVAPGGDRVWDMPASFGSDGSFQINYSIPGLAWIKSTGSGDSSSRLYVSLQGLTKNGECSVSLEQYGWK
jgi:hypothetical protein